MTQAPEWPLSVSDLESSGHLCWRLCRPPLLRGDRAWVQGVGFLWVSAVS